MIPGHQALGLERESCMKHFTHPQLAYGLNRVRRIPGPASPQSVCEPISQPEVDPLRPYFPCHTGFFDGCIFDENGEERRYVLYVPETMKTSGNSALVFIDGKTDVREWLSRNPWADILEEYEVAAFFIEAPDGWNLENPGYELDCASKLLAEMRNMLYYPSNADAVYALGFGDGAYIASVFAMTHVSLLAAFAVKGPCRVAPELMQWIGDQPSDCDAGIPKKRVSLPAWILDEGDYHPLVEYFQKAAHTKDEGLRNGYARVYRQKPKAGELYLNEQAAVEVWHSTAKEIEEKSESDILREMTAFVTHFKRWGGEGNSHIRVTLSPEDMGLKKYEMKIDGLNRYWYVFEPTAYKRHKKEAYPLVVAIHGFSCSGEFFAENSGWQSVAEERGFLVVFPTAYPFRRTVHPKGRASAFAGDICRTPVWNSSYEQDPQGPDDVSFIRQMLQAVKAQYPVDEARVYVTGHSNGSMMTQRLMHCMPEEFAGFAPVGAMGVDADGQAVPLPNDIPRPVWYVLGEYDIGSMSLEPGGINDKVLRNLCACNKVCYEEARFYENGIYQNTIVRNEDHVPMVRFTGVLNWPHTYTPELSLMIWDEFFCRLIRNKDGSITYLG